MAKLPKSFHFVTNLSSTTPVPLDMNMAHNSGIQLSPSLRSGRDTAFRKDARIANPRTRKKSNAEMRGSRKESCGKVRRVAKKLSRVRVSKSPRHEASGVEILSSGVHKQLLFSQYIGAHTRIKAKTSANQYQRTHE